MPLKRLRVFAWLAAGLWTAAVAAMMALDVNHLRFDTINLARHDAQVHFDWMQVFRSWVASHGGVYVPVDERTPPNTYLKVPDRDITTPSGKPLTLVNPAYMTRQVYGEYSDRFGIRGHITSLNLVRPENAPDEWERRALEEFKKGIAEKMEVVEMNGEPYLRLMQPLYVREPCLKCHEAQGYKVGQAHGGISVSVPLSSYLAKQNKEIASHLASHGLLWIIGLSGVAYGYRRLRGQMRQRMKAEATLRASGDILAAAQRIASIGSWELDLVKNELSWSGEIYRIFELDPKDFGASYEAFLDMVHPEDREFVDSAYTESVKNKTPYDITHRLLMKDGRVKYVNEKCETLYAADGTPLRSVGTVQDITERRTAELRLEESHQRLLAVLDGLDAIVYVADMETHEVLYVNKRAQEIFGDAVGKTCWRVFQKGQDGPCEFCANKYLLTPEREPAEPYIWEFRNTKTGRWLYISDRAIKWVDGRVVRMEIATDITDRKAAEEELKAANRSYKSLLELNKRIVEESPAGIIILDRDLRITYENPEMKRIIGVPEGEESRVMGVRITDVPSVKEAGVEYVFTRLKNRVNTQAEFPFRSIYGKEAHLSVRGAPMLDENGEFSGAILLILDVAERKRAEEGLRAANELLERMFDTSHFLLAYMDTDFNFIRVNRAYAEADGKEPGFFPGRNHFEMYPNEENERIFREVAKTGKPYTAFAKAFEYAGSPGRGVTYWDWTLEPVFSSARGKVEGVLLSLVNVTERIRAQEALRESEKKLSMITHVLGEGVYVLDREGKVTFMNPEAERLLGWAQEELLGRDMHDAIHSLFPDGTPHAAEDCSILRTINSGATYRRDDDFFMRKDGSFFPVSFVSTPIFENGEVAGSVAAFHDITERKRAEEEIARLGAAIEQAAEPIMVTDVDARLVYVNPAFEKVTGYSREEVAGVNPRILKGGKSDEAFYKLLWDTITGGKVWTGRFINKKKSGELYEEDATISPLMGPKGEIRGYVAVKRDVTKESRLERQVRQTQKLEAIGTLAGGIAHDFNNILTAIIGYAEMVREEVGDNDEAIEDITEVLKAGMRAKDLVKQILSFSRRGEMELKPVQPSLIVKEAVKFLRASIPTTIEIKDDVDKGAGTVMADPTQISQVVMNLCANAEYAMRETGGVLEVSLRAVDVDESMAEANEDLEPGPYIRLSVSDTGRGMDGALVSRIFEPFFTTKEKGEGTGMGLATAHGIVKSHGGAITVYSEPGVGSRFNVYLPRVETASEPVPVEEGPLPRGTERVLFVDDEAPLAKLGKRNLEELGYKVSAVSSGVEALKLFEKDPWSFDLVITDQTMPGMTGEELAKRALKIRPDIPVILLTGFSHLVTPESARKAGVADFLMKPVTKRSIATAARKALDAAPTGGEPPA